MGKIAILCLLLLSGIFITNCSSNNSGTGPQAPTPTPSGPSLPPTLTPTPSGTWFTSTPTGTPTTTPTCSAPVSMYFKATGDTSRQQIVSFGNQSTSQAVTQNPPYTSPLLPFCSGDHLYISAYYNDVAGGTSTVAIFNASNTPVATQSGSMYVVNGSGVTTGSGFVLGNYTMP